MDMDRDYIDCLLVHLKINEGHMEIKKNVIAGALARPGFCHPYSLDKSNLI